MEIHLNVIKYYHDSNPLKLGNIQYKMTISVMKLIFDHHIELANIDINNIFVFCSSEFLIRK